MPFRTALLLIALLPALLLPAGFAWHLCGCEPMGSTPAACCAQEDRGERPEPAATSCCCEPKSRLPAEDEGETAGCGACRNLVVPDDGNEPKTPESPVPPLPPLAPVVASPTAIPATAARVPCWPSAANRAPPPGHTRTLPLLI
jgi:hypothetical protein